MKDGSTTKHPPSRAAIDWDALHRRLVDAHATLETGGTPTAEKRKQILRDRAKALAREKQQEAGPGEFLEVLVFALADETYALETSYVREVHPLKEFTPLPGTAPFVVGLINVRGQLLAVVDIKKFFDLPEKGLTDLNKVIIVQKGGQELGVLADTILDVRPLPLAEVQPSLPTLTGIRADYLRGVAREGLVILDMGKLLSNRKLLALEHGAL